MRVLLITDWNRGRGGAERHAAAFLRLLREAGDDVELLTSSAGSAGDGEARFVAFGTERMAAQTFLQIANPFAFAGVRRAVREFRPDVAWVNMFAHHLSPAAVLALGDMPAVLMVSDYKCVCPLGSKLLPDASLCTVRRGWICHRGGCLGTAHWLRDQPRYALIDVAVRRFRRVVACSDWVRKELAFAGIPAVMIPYMVEAPGPFERRPAPEPVFVYTGRLDEEKGVALLLRSFARVRAGIPAARLRVIGQGPCLADLQRLASSLEITSAVEFFGWLAPEQAERHLRDAWAAVVPSLWPEPLGLVALEALLRGVPVIASVSGGLAEIVQDGVTGLLFPNNDESALTARLSAVASGAAFPGCRLLETAVQATAEIYDPGAHVRRMRALFREAVEEARAAG
ncbi:MAG: glycosyltransferase family 4 protein [Bryobacterales bacterium]|nr:glycosyltransferase family 4 protein [Bryobacterales bacterium]